MRLLGNIIWVVCGGLLSGLLWYACGIVAVLTVVGIPWARSCFMLGRFTLWPFGRHLIDRRLAGGRGDAGTGFWGVVGNVIWFLVIGWTLFLAHVASAFLCAATLIGIPFAVQHLKLAVACVAPIGKEVVALD